eukprot:COSAG04_NODE_278_length_18351_cov_17.582676_1_plen_147_part_00
MEKFNAAIAEAESEQSLQFAGKPMDGVDKIKELLAQAKELEARIREESTVFKQLESALEAKDEDDINDALSEAQGLKPPFENDIIGRCESFLKGEVDRRKREASLANKEELDYAADYALWLAAKRKREKKEKARKKKEAEAAGEEE